MRSLVAAANSTTRCTRSRRTRQGGRRLGISRVVAGYLLSVVTLLLMHHHGGYVVAASSSSSSSSKENNNNNNHTAPTTTTVYEWEDLNYYQILGLEDASSITSKDIRKAYRRQAQQWHPDKLAGKQQQQQAVDSKDHHVTTVEESNARFAKIAEAYSVLNNDETRNDYNRYLRQQQREQWQEQERDEQQREREQQRQGKQKPQQETASTSWSTWTSVWNDFDFFVQDPLRMFEEFFYGRADGVDEDEDDWLFGSDRHHHQEHGPRGSFFGGGTSGGGGAGSSSFQSPPPPYQQNYPNQHQRPIRTYQQEQVWMDPASGQEILRILQTNEYEQGQGQQQQGQQQVYYRTVAQDFVEEWDRYQRAFVYYPLQFEPFVVDEGYLDRPQHPPERTRQRRGGGEESNSNSKNKQQQRGTLASTLLPGDVLVPDDDRPLLQNGRYTAGISDRSCELWIADNFWNVVSWTSDTDLLTPGRYHPYQQNCQLTLRGSYLVLATVGYPEQLLWYSDADNVDDDYYDDTTASDDSYFARLDSDGSLAVYEKRTVDRCPQWLLQILSSSSAAKDNEKPTTATGRWAKPRRFGIKLLRLVFDRVPFLSLVEPVQPRQSSSTSTSLPTLQRLVCVSATGPVGCLSILRPVVKRLRDVMHAVQWAVSKLDHFLETV